jgi:DNA-binding helix-hairpin-helix protein with protein kinase domain
MAEYTRAGGARLILERQLGEGGEGAVWTIQDEPELCAKIWRQPTPASVDKLSEILGLYTTDRAEIAAWPREMVRGADGEACGFVMERLEGWLPLFRGYQIKSRQQWLPTAKFGFLVRLARNAAACVERVHQAGMVIGDINESNMLINGRAVAKLIDVDSFQLRVDGRLYPCEVAKPEYMAPELAANPETDRTTEQDRFALAVLLFQILCFGRHPFSGRAEEGQDMSLEDAIRRGAYAYAAHGPLRPPPGMDLSWLSPEVRALFEASFQEPPTGRPSAAAWHAELLRLEDALRPCEANPAHEEPSAAEECAFCQVERSMRVAVFGRVKAMVRSDSALPALPDIEMLSGLLEELPAPAGPPVSFRAVEPADLGVLGRIGRVAHVTMPGWAASSLLLFWPAVPPQVGAGVWAALGLGLSGITVSRLPWKAWRLGREYRQLMVTRLELMQKWADSTGAGSMVLAAEEAMREWRALEPGGPREAELERRLMMEVYGVRMQAYLRKHSVATCPLEEMPPTLLRQLATAGVQTVADISAKSLAGVPLPAEMRTQLLDWREKMERHYWATSTHMLPMERQRQLEHALAQERRECADRLRRSSQTLPDRLAHESADREQILGRIAQIDRRLAEIAPQLHALEKALGGRRFSP